MCDDDAYMSCTWRMKEQYYKSEIYRNYTTSIKREGEECDAKRGL